MESWTHLAMLINSVVLRTNRPRWLKKITAQNDGKKEDENDDDNKKKLK